MTELGVTNKPAETLVGDHVDQAEGASVACTRSLRSSISRRRPGTRPGAVGHNGHAAAPTAGPRRPELPGRTVVAHAAAEMYGADLVARTELQALPPVRYERFADVLLAVDTPRPACRCFKHQPRRGLVIHRGRVVTMPGPATAAAPTLRTGGPPRGRRQGGNDALLLMDSRGGRIAGGGAGLIEAFGERPPKLLELPLFHPCHLAHRLGSPVDRDERRQKSVESHMCQAVVLPEEGQELLERPTVHRRGAGLQSYRVPSRSHVAGAGRVLVVVWGLVGECADVEPGPSAARLQRTRRWRPSTTGLGIGS